MKPGASTRRTSSTCTIQTSSRIAPTHSNSALQPYEHGVDSLATWLIVSGRRYSGDMHEDSEELAVLLRFFRKMAWIEVGATTDGKLQAMAMFSF